MWITNSKEADIFLIFANVKPEDGYKGITCFIVDKTTDMQSGNLSVDKKENKLGIRASSTCSVIFEDLKVHFRKFENPFQINFYT